MTSKRDENREQLIHEAVSGETKMDTLPDNAAMPLCGEAEAMYFKSIRDFFKNRYITAILNS